MKKVFLALALLITSFTNAQLEEKKYTDGLVVTAGFLKGGGSLVGVDIEFGLYKKLAGQVGFGFVGFGGGLNLHYKENLNSNFLSLQFYNQGIGDSHTQSILGGTYNFRAFNFLAGSIGYGVKVLEGPAYYKIPSQLRTSAMLLYSLGVYKLF